MDVLHDEEVAVSTRVADVERGHDVGVPDTSREPRLVLHTLAAATAAAGDFKGASQWISTALEKAPANEKQRVGDNQKLIFSGTTITD